MPDVRSLPRCGMEDLEHSFTFQLWRASNAWQRQLRRILEPIGITHTQFIVLVIADRLARVEPWVTQTMIHEVADLDENLTSQVVRSLQTKGLIERQRHPEDRRSIPLVLTIEGKQIVESGRALILVAKEAFASPLGERQSEVAHLLSAVADSQEVPVGS